MGSDGMSWQCVIDKNFQEFEQTWEGYPSVTNAASEHPSTLDRTYHFARAAFDVQIQSVAHSAHG